MRPDLTIESLEAIKATEKDIGALADAYDKLSASLMPEATVAVAEAAVDHPEAPGNIVGFGIGEKITRGEPTGRPAVKVLVREKVDPDELTEATMVPETIEGVATDVDETGEIVAYQGGGFRKRHRPAPGGVSISNCNENAAGTLGCWADADKSVCILSNNHVLAMVNDSPPNAPIAQPGRLDRGACPKDVIAELLRFVPINFTGTNEVDAAIAAATDSNYVESRILRRKRRLDKLRSPHLKASLAMRVQKSGRTTGWTHGTVDMVATTVNVGYPGNRVARFDNQFRVTAARGAFSQAGDSGSLVTTDKENHPVGLLFAGGVGPGGLAVTFCNPIELVLQALTAEIHY